MNKPSQIVLAAARSLTRRVRTSSTRARLVALLALGALIASVAFTSTSYAEHSESSSAQVDAAEAKPQVEAMTAIKPKVFHGDLRKLPKIKISKKDERPEPQEPEDAPMAQLGEFDGVLQRTAPEAAAPAPAPSSSFAGLDFQNWGAGWPPDTNGDVGPNHYIQTVNTSIGIYRKSDGTRLAAFTFDQFFSQGATGTPCDNANQGDPVALYDALADRWIITDFAWSNYTSGAMYQCMAVSQTSDPVAGGWYFYAWQTHTGGQIADYPKLGVWPDGIYMSANMFNTTTGAFVNPKVWAFNRLEMEAGQPAHGVSFTVPKSGSVTYFSFLPSNVRDNGSAPPAGTPNYFVEIYGSTVARVFKFKVDYTTPANSTFTNAANVTLSSFGAGPASVPEKQGNAVDTLAYRLMMQNQYQNLNGTESLWLTHTVAGSTSSIAAVRWYQLNVTGGTVPTTPVQQATWAPDTKNRFMPSLSLDKDGDMALGYTVSDATMFPSLRYAGRLKTDTASTLGQTETSLIEGTGFQCCSFSDGTVNTRYGDYSAMTTDPDGCTFWFTSEYFDASPTTLAGDNWKTRVGSFRYSQCTPRTMGTLQGTVTDASTGNPVAGALVTFGIHTLKTDANGAYQFPNLLTGTYSVVVTASGYSASTTNNVIITSGATTTRNVQLGATAVNTTLTVGSASAVYGGTTTLTATLTQAGGSAASGKTVTFTLNGASFANNTATTDSNGVATLSNVSVAGINAGSYSTGVGASFAGGGGLNASSGTNSLNIAKATPIVTWSNPADITYGTALGGSQLNATANVPGQFAYSPAAGTVLGAGNNQTLSANFTPTDTTNFNNASGSVSINVQQATLTVKANDQTRAYGQDNPSLTYTMTGFVNNDTQASATSGAPTLTTTATSTSDPGQYPITITAGTLAATNYAFNFVNGTLTVTPPTLYTISGQVTKGSGGIAGISMTLSGSQSNTTQTDANGNYSFTVNAGGNYTVTPSSSGYNFRPVSRSFTNLSGNQTANFTAQKRQSLADFDGDGKTDVAVYRPNDDGAHQGQWYILNSQDNSVTQQLFGAETDVITPGDFNGDGKTDIAVFRGNDDGAGASAWYISKGSAQNFDRRQWGAQGDVPVAADYDGDGLTDIAVFRPSDGTWYILQSSDNGFRAQQWGLATDKPVPGDFDGDGKTDIAVFRPSDGTWYILASSTNGLMAQQWGLATDRPMQGDYDGDSITDIAVFRPDGGMWYVLKSSTNNTAFDAMQWGFGTDITVTGDYDGDGKFDIGVFRANEGTWYINQSTSGSMLGLQWGTVGDKPTAAFQLPE
jgi:hypothetical protein